jgi:hypothetical protein
MTDDLARVFTRLVVVVAALSYILVFTVALATGAEPELASLKALIAMFGLGMLGWVFRGIAAPQPRRQEKPRASTSVRQARLDVDVPAAPNELAGGAE